ncbi:hypothetical protein C7212DRAFT_364910 [Tuber magnatum]|uniref:Uncharacterized protein n=1 Tax=Tuber magnatum TaxID=42249 RepID=A0A317SMG1_9PEZI|nr:hypothetical protein C7212DRAFT_364910 [Tuber magnatum]
MFVGGEEQDWFSRVGVEATQNSRQMEDAGVPRPEKEALAVIDLESAVLDWRDSVGWENGCARSSSKPPPTTGKRKENWKKREEERDLYSSTGMPLCVLGGYRTASRRGGILITGNAAVPEVGYDMLLFLHTNDCIRRDYDAEVMELMNVVQYRYRTVPQLIALPRYHNQHRMIFTQELPVLYCTAPVPYFTRAQRISNPLRYQSRSLPTLLPLPVQYSYLNSAAAYQTTGR